MRARRAVPVALLVGAAALTVSARAAEDAAAYNRCLAETRAEAAIRACEKALDSTALTDDQRAEAYLALGRQLRRNEEFEAALVSLGAAAALAPYRGDVQSEIAVALHLEGDLAAARDAHENAFALGPVTLRMFNNRGVTLLASGDAVAALADFDAALAALVGGGAEAGDLWNNRANARCAAGDVDGSVEDRVQALYSKRFTAAAAQRGLRTAGFYKGPADGIWAQNSEDALHAWTGAGCPDAPATRFL